jgi:hypothetical protein
MVAQLGSSKDSLNCSSKWYLKIKTQKVAQKGS